MRTHDKYVLDQNGQVIPETDLLKWGAWFETGQRQVGDDKIGNARISTVFLGLDHGFGDDGPPILWETMVFGGKLDGAQARCSGQLEQAQYMHAVMVERVKKTNTKWYRFWVWLRWFALGQSRGRESVDR